MKLCRHHLCPKAGTCKAVPFVRAELPPLTSSSQELPLTCSFIFHLGVKKKKKKESLFKRLLGGGGSFELVSGNCCIRYLWLTTRSCWLHCQPGTPELESGSWAAWRCAESDSRGQSLLFSFGCKFFSFHVSCLPRQTKKRRRQLVEVFSNLTSAGSSARVLVEGTPSESIDGT